MEGRRREVVEPLFSHKESQIVQDKGLRIVVVRVDYQVGGTSRREPTRVL